MPVFPACSFPSIDYLRRILRFRAVKIDLGEHYRKQTLRNRFELLGPNGRLAITVHVEGRKGEHVPMNEVRIVDDEWRRLAWKGICSCYGKSPFFLHYEEEIKAIIYSGHEQLAAFNLESTRWLCEHLGIDAELEVSEVYINEPETDYRNDFKRGTGIAVPEYPQVFSDRFAFESNISGLDLLCNCGPESYRILTDGIG